MRMRHRVAVFGFCVSLVAAPAGASSWPAPGDASVRVDAQGYAAHAAEPRLAQPAGTAGGDVQWFSLGPPGADVSDVEASPTTSGVVLAGVAPGGSWGGMLYRSGDAGAHWEIVDDLSSRSVHRVAFASDGTAYAATQNRVWKSSDDGQHWTQLAFGFSNPNDETFAVTVDPNDDAVLWAGLTDALGSQPINLMRSPDGGTTWEDRTPPHAAAMTCVGVAVDPADSGHVAAVFRGSFGGGEIWVSTDGGTTWDNRSAGLPNNPLNAVAFAGDRLLVGGGQNFGSQYVGLYASDDLGATWTPLHTSNWPLRVVTDIAIDPADVDTILVATDGAGINRSTDGGASWTVRVTGSAQLAAQSVSFDGNAVYAGASSLAVFKSADGGASFAQSADGISQINLYSIAVSPLDTTQVAVAFQGANNGGVYSTTDGGAHWTLEDLPPTRYSSVGYAPDGTLYAISSGPTGIAQEGLYRREGDGSWTLLGPDQGPLFESNLDTMRFSADDPDLILLGGGDFGVAGWGSTVWRSTDAGQNWTKVFLGDDNDMVTDIEIAADSADAAIVAVYDGFTPTQQGGAIRSDDGGTTWAPALGGLPDYMRQPHLCQTAGTPSALYLAAASDASNGALYRSGDAGASWTATDWSGPVAADVACDPLDEQVLYLAQSGPNRVVRSGDGGDTFAPFDAGLSGASSATQLAAAAADGATQLFLSTMSGSYSTAAPVPADDTIFEDGFDG